MKEESLPDRIELHPTTCPICKSLEPCTELYPANFDFQHFNPAIFSARRLPDGVHYRMVKCDGCGLVRAEPVADPLAVFDLYSKSGFDYSEEVPNLKRTYGRYLKKVDNYVKNKCTLLEMGCGNGFFLEEAIAMGYESVKGVEPSMKAIEASEAHIRPNIVCDIMRSGIFGADEFDVICMFQVLDHISDLTTLLKECFKVLKPGGVVLSLTHNLKSLSARLLRDASPIVDIEHTFLFSKRTIAKLFQIHKFEIKQSGSVLNCYTIKYLVHLAPIAPSLKQVLMSVLVNSGLGRLSLLLPLGNLYLITQKPAAKIGSGLAGSQ